MIESFPFGKAEVSWNWRNDDEIRATVEKLLREHNSSSLEGFFFLLLDTELRSFYRLNCRGIELERECLSKCEELCSHNLGCLALVLLDESRDNLETLPTTANLIFSRLSQVLEKEEVFENEKEEELFSGLLLLSSIFSLRCNRKICSSSFVVDSEQTRRVLPLLLRAQQVGQFGELTSFYLKILLLELDDCDDDARVSSLLEMFLSRVNDQNSDAKVVEFVLLGEWVTSFCLVKSIEDALLFPSNMNSGDDYNNQKLLVLWNALRNSCKTRNWSTAEPLLRFFDHVLSMSQKIRNCVLVADVSWLMTDFADLPSGGVQRSALRIINMLSVWQMVVSVVAFEEDERNMRFLDAVVGRCGLSVKTSLESSGTPPPPLLIKPSSIPLHLQTPWTAHGNGTAESIPKVTSLASSQQDEISVAVEVLVQCLQSKSLRAFLMDRLSPAEVHRETQASLLRNCLDDNAEELCLGLMEILQEVVAIEDIKKNCRMGERNNIIASFPSYVEFVWRLLRSSLSFCILSRALNILFGNDSSNTNNDNPRFASILNEIQRQNLMEQNLREHQVQRIKTLETLIEENERANNIEIRRMTRVHEQKIRDIQDRRELSHEEDAQELQGILRSKDATIKKLQTEVKENQFQLQEALQRCELSTRSVLRLEKLKTSEITRGAELNQSLMEERSENERLHSDALAAEQQARCRVKKLDETTKRLSLKIELLYGKLLCLAAAHSKLRETHANLEEDLCTAKSAAVAEAATANVREKKRDAKLQSYAKELQTISDERASAIRELDRTKLTLKRAENEVLEAQSNHKIEKKNFDTCKREKDELRRELDAIETKFKEMQKFFSK